MQHPKKQSNCTLEAHKTQKHNRSCCNFCTTHPFCEAKNDLDRKWLKSAQWGGITGGGWRLSEKFSELFNKVVLNFDPESRLLPGVRPDFDDFC